MRALLQGQSAEREGARRRRRQPGARPASKRSAILGVCVVDAGRVPIERCDAALGTIVGGADVSAGPLATILPPLRIIPGPPYVALEDSTSLQGVDFATDGKRRRATTSTMPEGPARSVCVFHDVGPARRRGESVPAQAQQFEAAGRSRQQGVAHEIDDMMTVKASSASPVESPGPAISRRDDPGATSAGTARPRRTRVRR